MALKFLNFFKYTKPVSLVPSTERKISNLLSHKEITSFGDKKDDVRTEVRCDIEILPGSYLLNSPESTIMKSMHQQQTTRVLENSIPSEVMKHQIRTCAEPLDNKFLISIIQNPTFPAKLSISSKPNICSPVITTQKRQISTLSELLLQRRLIPSEQMVLPNMICKKDVLNSIGNNSYDIENHMCQINNYGMPNILMNHFSSKSRRTSDWQCETKRKKTCKNRCKVIIKRRRTRRKRLPKFVPQDCPCTEKGLNPNPPRIKRLIPRSVPDPSRICHKPCHELATRADDGLKINFRELPVMKPTDCSCSEPYQPTYAPRIARLNLFVPEPQRDCRQECHDVSSRADTGIKIKRKELPSYEPSDCPCPPDKKPRKNVKIRRLKAKLIPEPERECPVHWTEFCTRADDGLRVIPRDLPAIKPQDECRCQDFGIPTKTPQLQRLNLHVPEPPRLCPKLCRDITQRADDGLRIKRKILPFMKPSDCPCAPNATISDLQIARLVPKPVRERSKRCARPCQELAIRADDGLEIRPKELPLLKAPDCPCLEIERLADSPKLSRLNLHVPEPPKICPSKCAYDVRRADDGRKVRRKRLAPFVAADCPCPEREFVPRGRPLKKLIPKPVPVPERECPVHWTEFITRADDGLKVTPRELPNLKLRPCACIEPIRQRRGSKIQRPHFKRIREPEKKCPPPCKADNIPRSDQDGWEYEACCDKYPNPPYYMSPCDNTRN